MAEIQDTRMSRSLLYGFVDQVCVWQRGCLWRGYQVDLLVSWHYRSGATCFSFAWWRGKERNVFTRERVQKYLINVLSLNELIAALNVDNITLCFFGHTKEWRAFWRFCRCYHDRPRMLSQTNCILDGTSSKLYWQSAAEHHAAGHVKNCLVHSLGFTIWRWGIGLGHPPSSGKGGQRSSTQGRRRCVGVMGPFRSEQLTPPMPLIGALFPKSCFDRSFRVCLPSA